jgi:hypothetical protein
MLRKSLLLLVMCVAAVCSAANQYLFVWAGDDAHKAPDFLAVIDADPSSRTYAQVIASVAVPGPSGIPHHTEWVMAPGGYLLANQFESGQTVLFDLRSPRQPKFVTQFGGFDGYMHPHTYVRLPNGHVLATFQYRGGHDPKAEGGGLVEFDQRGKFIRASSAVPKAADPAMKNELIRPYSLLVIPALDRVVSTNTAMHDKDGSSRTVQVWRLSDLKLLRTLALPKGPSGREEQLPGEPWLAADGRTVLIHTFQCGLYRLDGVAGRQFTVKHVYTFEGEWCDVPMRAGKYWIQTLHSAHALVAMDISDFDHIREVSRLKFDDKQMPHWISPDESGRRIVLNSGEYGEHRIYMINFDPQTGKLALDERFRDAGSDQPGVSMDGKSWPHGFKGDAFPHGTVFSRTK